MFLRRLIFLILFLSCVPFLGHASSLGLSDSDIKLYKRCFAAAKQNRWEYARTESLAAKNKLPAKILLWMDLTRPGPGRAFEDYRRFIEENPLWPRQEIMLAQAERAMPADLPAQEVISWFGNRMPLTAAGGVKLAQALSVSGKDATSMVRQIWIQEDFDKRLASDFLQEWAKKIRPEDHMARMDRLLWDGEIDQAQQMLPYLKSGRKLAEARIALQRSQPNALALYKALDLEQRKSGGLRLDLARYYRRNNKPEEAKLALDPPPITPLRPDSLWTELERAARLALEGGDNKLAYRLARGHGAKEGIVFAEGEFLAGWIALRKLNDAKSALSHFESIYKSTNTSLSKSRGSYWAYRAASALGNQELAKYYLTIASQYPLTFYGQMALLADRGVKPFSPPKSPQPDVSYSKLAAKDELVQAVQLLGKLGEKELAKPFLQHIAARAKKPADITFLAKLGNEIGGAFYSLYAAKEGRKAGFDIADALFPMTALPHPLRTEAALILGVVKQESAFDPAAQSSAGALGYMQLLPSTAKDVAKKLKVPFSTEKLTRDGQFNIRLGQDYLASLVNGFDGSYVLALAAYNAGPGRVRQWLEKYGHPHGNGTDVLDWIENIPFAETRNYVQRVLENTQIYRLRLNKGPGVLMLTKDLGYKEAANAAQ